MLRCDVSGCATQHGDIPSLRDAPKGELHQARWAGRRPDAGDEPLHDYPQQDHKETQHSNAGMNGFFIASFKELYPFLRAGWGLLNQYYSKSPQTGFDA